MKWVLGAGISLFGAALGCSAAGSAISAAASDAGVADASESEGDATTNVEDGGTTNVDDSGSDGADSAASKLACPPGPAAGFSPTWKPPKPLHANACSVAQAELAVDCAFNPNSKASTCDAFFADAGNTDCMLCVLTDDFDTSYGPVIMQGTYAVLNLAGCIAHLAGDSTATGCGAKVQAITECQEFACASCPNPDTSAQALSDYLDCQRAAMSSVCASYVTAGSCADPLITPDGGAAECASGSNTFLDRARRLARLFCGP